MVNGTVIEAATERRERTRPGVEHARLGQASLNPFGDLITLQHLSARFARSLRGLFEPLLRKELRSWAEPLVVQRFADYRAERPDGLTAWLPLAMTGVPETQALTVLDGRFVLELLDLFFGGSGHVPHDLPSEFSPAAEETVARLGEMLSAPLAAAWEPLTRIGFTPGHPEANPAMLSICDGDDPVIVTRFGLAAGTAKPVFIDILYPVAALKPHGASLTGKVHAKTAAPDPAWQHGLTRAVMDVRLPVRSVLAETSISLERLMNLKPGDIVPIAIGGDVPVTIGGDRLGAGTVGTSNGRAAIRLNTLAHALEDFQ